MSEQAGSSVAVIQERQALLARQHDAVAEADRELADVLASAHAAMRESVRRLDAIAAELDRAVPDQDQLAVDTPMGAREFQTFLVAKQREIVAVVAAAHELDRAKSAVLKRACGHSTRNRPVSCGPDTLDRQALGELSATTHLGTVTRHGSAGDRARSGSQWRLTRRCPRTKISLPRSGTSATEPVTQTRGRPG